MSFESRLFKRFFLPGLIIEMLVILGIFLPESINPLHDLSFLKMRLGGTAMWKVGLVRLPLQLQTLFFFLVAFYYSFRLPILYKRGNPKYVKATRNFLIYGDIAIVAIIIQIVCLFCRLGSVDIEVYVNLPVVLPVFAAGIIMAAFFIYWTVRTYQEENLKFISKDTLKSIGTALILFICAIIVLIACYVSLLIIGNYILT